MWSPVLLVLLFEKEVKVIGKGHDKNYAKMSNIIVHLFINLLTKVMHNVKQESHTSYGSKLMVKVLKFSKCTSM